MNFARLNHILIPTSREGRDRFRRSLIGRLFGPTRWLYDALSDEGRALALLTLFVGMMSLEVSTTQTYLLWSGLFAALVGAVMVRPAFRLGGVELRLDAPARVPVGEPLRIALTLVNGSLRHHSSIRLRGPFLPWDGSWLGELPTVQQLAPGARVTREVRARFVARGSHHLDPFSAAALVPMGLSQGHRIRGPGCRFLVVPRVARVERLDLPLGRRYQPGGIAQASRIGDAMELVGVRPYRRGDSARDLHARTWARTGVPHVREYQQEYFTRVGVIVDNDGGVMTEAGLEALLSLSAGVVAKLTRGEALIDLLVVGDELHAFTLGRHLGFLEQALDMLATVQPGGPFDADAVLARLDPFVGQLSSLLLVSQSGDAERLRLLDALARRGVGGRLLRVVDERKGWRRPAATPSGDPRARDLTVSAIESGDPLWL